MKHTNIHSNAQCNLETVNEKTAPERYPFKDMGLGGIEIKKLGINILNKKYDLEGFNIRMNKKKKQERRFLCLIGFL